MDTRSKKKCSEIINDFNKENNSNFILEDYKLFVLGEGVETNTKDFKEEVASQLTDIHKWFSFMEINKNSINIAIKKRIMLKLSGEILVGKQKYGLDPDKLISISEDICNVYQKWKANLYCSRRR